MLFQPAIIALLLASGAATLMLLAAAPFAVQVMRRWDIASGSELQLALERRTYLFSTLLTFVFVVQLAALLLFVFTADRLSSMFVGAMCAVGTLNVNVWGFPALLSQLLMFFAAAGWLAINHADTLAPDYPLVRIKYAAMLLLTPLLATCFGLQLAYFLGLKADVITSCCGSLFSGDGKSLTSEVSALAPPVGMAVLFGFTATAAAVAFIHQRTGGRVSGYATALTSTLAFGAAIVGILSFLSLYIYEHPHHHCPFCILKPEYNYLGYGLYVPLFAGTAAGLAAGVLQPFRCVASLTHVIPAVSRRLAHVSGAGFLVFGAAAAGMVAGSNLILIGQ